MRTIITKYVNGINGNRLYMDITAYMGDFLNISRFGRGSAKVLFCLVE